MHIHSHFMSSSPLQALPFFLVAMWLSMFQLHSEKTVIWIQSAPLHLEILEVHSAFHSPKAWDQWARNHEQRSCDLGGSIWIMPDRLGKKKQKKKNHGEKIRDDGWPTKAILQKKETHKLWNVAAKTMLCQPFGKGPSTSPSSSDSKSSPHADVVFSFHFTNDPIKAFLRSSVCLSGGPKQHGETEVDTF